MAASQNSRGEEARGQGDQQDWFSGEWSVGQDPRMSSQSDAEQRLFQKRRLPGQRPWGRRRTLHDRVAGALSTELSFWPSFL